MEEKNSQRNSYIDARPSRYLIDLRVAPSTKSKSAPWQWLRDFVFELFENRSKKEDFSAEQLPETQYLAKEDVDYLLVQQLAKVPVVQPVEVRRSLLSRFLWLISLPVLTLGQGGAILSSKALKIFNTLLRSPFFVFRRLKKNSQSWRRRLERVEERLLLAEEETMDRFAYFEARETKSRGVNWRLGLGFFAILLILILPLKGFSYFESLDDLRLKVLSSSESAIAELFKAGKSAGSFNFGGASQDFTAASRQFASAQDNLEQINSLVFALAKLVPNDQAKLAGNSLAIIEAGKVVSDLGVAISNSIDGLIADRTNGLDVALRNLVKNGQEAVRLSSELDSILSTIDSEVLPIEMQAKFSDLRARSGVFHNSLAELTDLADKFLILTGSAQDTRYLMVFQNNSELRASGGFFGSYALLDFSKGKIKKIEVPAGGTYDVEAGYFERYSAPTPLRLVNPLWHLWDANWWYDWPTTAKKLAWFYEKSSGPTVDGVISLTPTVIEDLLRAYGPVDLIKDYGVVITADNFWQVTQTFSEQKPDVTVKPKRIIGDMFNMMISDMPQRLNRQMLLSMYDSLQKSFKEKQAMVYFKDQKLADFANQYGWDGRVKETALDYLAVINSSVAGGKSDREISQVINHHASVLADGSVIDELEIVRTHHAVRGQLFVGQRNVDWLRVYVPQGSELIEASGFNAPEQKYFEKPDPAWKLDPDLLPEEKNFQIDQLSGTKIYDELGKTVFANWSMIDPGETKSLRLKYRLPFKVVKLVKPEVNEEIAKLFNLPDKAVAAYGLLAQKQPGSLNVVLSSSLSVEPYQRQTPSDLAWFYPETLSNANISGWQITEDFNLDRYYAIMLSQK